MLGFFIFSLLNLVRVLPTHQTTDVQTPKIKNWYHEIMRTIKREIVSGLIFSKDGKLLMGMKDPKHGGVYSDCWHIPGGGVEAEETKEQALHREIQEETGIDISNANVSLADDQGSGQTEKTLKETGERVLCNMKFNVYRIDLSTNAKETQLNPSDDLPTLEWVDTSKLSEYKLTPPSASLFERIGLIGI